MFPYVFWTLGCVWNYKTEPLTSILPYEFPEMTIQTSGN